MTEGHLSQPRSGDASAGLVSGAGAFVDRRPGLVVAALCVLPMVLVALSSVHGLGASPDSAGYVAAARSFASDGQFTYWDGKPMSHFPPGFSLVLGTFALVGIDPKVSAIFVNLLAVGALVALTYVVGRLILESPRPGIMAAGIVAVASTTVHIYAMLLSEAVFVTLCMVAVWLLTRMVRDGVRPITFVAVVTCVSLACAVRWIGVSLIPLVALSLVVAEAHRGLPRAVAIGVLGGVLASAGTLAVALRNLALVGSLTGSWSQSHATVDQLVRAALHLIGRWFVPRAGSSVSSILGLVVIALAAYGAWRLLRDGRARRLAVPVVLFAAGYPLVLLISELRVDGIVEDRYLAPVLAPTALLVVAGLGDIWRRMVGGAKGLGLGAPAWPARRIVAWSLAGILAVSGLIYVATHGINVTSYAVGAATFGRGYTAADLRSSELARAAGALSSDVGLLTNDPVIVYWVSERHPIPSIQALRLGGDPGQAVRDEVSAGTLTRYAEFREAHTGQGVPADKLREWGIALEDPIVYADGTLYRMTLAPGS